MHCKSQMPLEKALLPLIRIIQTNGKQSLGRYCISLLRKQVITHDKLLLSLVLIFEEWWFYSHKQTQLAFGNLCHPCLICNDCNLKELLGFPSLIAIIHAIIIRAIIWFFFLKGATYFTARELFNEESVHTHLQIKRPGNHKVKKNNRQQGFWK